ncbi:ALQxL family class IV lanthipeptide [Streptomyces virginiae]
MNFDVDGLQELPSEEPEGLARCTPSTCSWTCEITCTNRRTN